VKVCIGACLRKLTVSFHKAFNFGVHVILGTMVDMVESLFNHFLNYLNLSTLLIIGIAFCNSATGIYHLLQKCYYYFAGFAPRKTEPKPNIAYS